MLVLLLVFVVCGPNNESNPGNNDDPDPDNGEEGDDNCPEELSGVNYRDMIKLSEYEFAQQDDYNNKFINKISPIKVAKYEVTYELWYKVYKWAGENGYHFQNSGTEGSNGSEGADPTDENKYQPVTTISWRDAIVWCNAYSELCEYSPVYKFEGNVIKDSREEDSTTHSCPHCDESIMDISANGYRLPTESEWQYAASYVDGKKFKQYDYASGASSNFLNSNSNSEVAWYVDNSEDKTHIVGKKKPTKIGICDMSGNVWEFCWDYHGNYPSIEDVQTNYSGPAEGNARIRRGGSWKSKAKFLQVGHRSADSTASKMNTSGLRVVRSVKSDS